MRIYKIEADGRREIEWKGLVEPEELAKHVNAKTSEVHAATRWPRWWALRCSRRLAVEPWAQDIAATFIIRRILEKGEEYEVEDVSPTMPLLLTPEEQSKVTFPRLDDFKPRSPLRGYLLWVLKRTRNRYLLRHLPKPWKSSDSCDLLVHTVILPECISPEGKLNDFFFPGVQACAEAKGKKVLTFGLAAALPAGMAAGWKRQGNWAVFDELIGLPEFREAFRAMKRMRRAIEDWTEPVADLPAEWLKARWNEDLQSAEFFDSVASAKWVSSFCHDRSTKFYVYSFERKTFEQAILKAVHEDSPRTITCGYQNAAVTNKHYHFWSYTSGDDVIPHRILTVGDVTTELLAGAGRYPQERLKVGGALRQRALLERKVLRRPVQNLLVLWAEGRDQYEKFWTFLKAAWDQTDLSRFSFRIRPHPAIPFDFPGGEKFSSRYELDPLPDIRQSIDWADAILYASTSLAIVAAGSGIPVLSIRLPGYFDDDCLPANGKMLHWRVESPGDLKKSLEAIEALYDEDFDEMLVGSEKFEQRYFRPATAESFLEALEGKPQGGVPISRTHVNGPPKK